MHKVLEVAAFLSFGAATCYLFGRKLKRKANYMDSIIRVIELQCLDKLLTKETTNLLVVVSRRVGSAVPLDCKHNGLLGVLMEEKAELDCKIELEDGSLIEKSLKFLLHQEETPWYLEDSTGQVNVLGAQDAVGFDYMLNEYVLDMSTSELFKRVGLPEGTKVLKHNCHGRALNIGTFLTFVGEAVRDKAGNLMIQRPKEQSFLVYSGEDSFNNMVDDLKSDSEVYILLAKIFGTIAVGVSVMYVVNCIRRVLLPFEWEKEELPNRPENAKLDSTETHQREESDLPIGLAYLLAKDSAKDC